MIVNKLNKETQLIVKLTEDLYRKSSASDIDISEVDVDKFVDSASRNNILFYVMKKISAKAESSFAKKDRFEKIISDAKLKITAMRKSIDEINEHVNEGIIFKTYRGFERIPSDIDVLVNDFDSAMSSFVSMGYEIENYDKKEKSVGLLKQDQAKIHLQSSITWAWTYFMNEDFIISNPRKVIFFGKEIVIPNASADFLIHLAHMNFEPLHMTFSELIYLFNLIPAVNFDAIFKQAKKFRWYKTLIETLNLMNNFHDIIYGGLCFDKVPFRKLTFKKLSLPFNFTRGHIIKSAFEKRLFVYPLTKIIKVIDVLLSGDPYTKYYTPPDKEEGEFKHLKK